MSENKICVQCGRLLHINNYKMYKSRSTGLRDTQVGRHTVCIECERFNVSVTSIWRQEFKSKEDLELLTRAENFYKTLVDKGLEPKGAFARHIMDLPPPKIGRVARTGKRAKSYLDDYEAKSYAKEADIHAEYKDMLKWELVGEPDEYQDKLLELLERSSSFDGKVLDIYKEEFNAVAQRFDDYEDNYNWEK